MPKNKIKKTDGLGQYEIGKIRSAMRIVWHRSRARQLVVKRCLAAGGFSVCERCFDTVPKIYVDHINAVGDVDAGFIRRLFCPSSELQGICKKCHDEKTQAERKALKALSKSNK